MQLLEGDRRPGKVDGRPKMVGRRAVLRGFVAAATVIAAEPLLEACQSSKPPKIYVPKHAPFPERIPGELNQYLSSVVYIRAPQRTGTVLEFSGVNIGGDGYFLTAGHALRDENGQLRTDVTCTDDAKVYGTTPEGRLVCANVIRTVSLFDINGKQPDLALIQTDVPLNQLASAVGPTRPLTPGEDVIFENYGGTSPDPDRKGKLPAPALFGGVVLDKTDPSLQSLSDQVPVLVGEVSYGPNYTTDLLHKGSGGGVFSLNGPLHGVSVSYNGRRPSIGYIQPFDLDVVNGLVQKIRTNPDFCVR